MVQIVIKMCGDASEWGLIELQGALESKDDMGFNGLYVGDLHFDVKGTPNLIIGHHLLVGKVVDLEKPFAVLRKNLMEIGDKESEDTMDFDNEILAEKREQSYDIVALIKKKIIFKNRPRPIITNTIPIKR